MSRCAKQVERVETSGRLVTPVTSHLVSTTNALSNTFPALMHVFTFSCRRKAQHDASACVCGVCVGGMREGKGRGAGGDRKLK